MWTKLIAISDLMLFVVLAGCGAWVMGTQYQRPDAAAAAALAGALFGGSAILLGNWITRFNDRRRMADERDDQCAKLKTLIAAELVNVAAGLIGSKEYFHAAAEHARTGGVLPPQPDLEHCLPRDMPFLVAAGTELLLLDQPSVDALVTLRGNLALTSAAIGSIADGRDRFGILRVGAVSTSLSNDLEILAQAFEHIAPARMLKLPGQDAAELVSVLLRRVAVNG